MNDNYDNTIKMLTSQGKFYINLGLERISEILKYLGNPQKKLKCIHVAGTNGKGSVCAMLNSVLTQKYKVGLYTSPHIFDYTERIKINSKPISKNDFANLVNEIFNSSEKINVHLSEFEILTCAAFYYFAQQNVDIAIIEVGLGGRLDATNVIEKPLCSIITNLSLDHTERLGNSIEKIAFEKAGIIKKDCPVIISTKNLGFDTIHEITKERNAKLFKVENDNSQYKLSLKGSYQKENSALVLKALEILEPKLSKETIEKGLLNAKHKCRFELLIDENIIIDGAHNPNGTKLLRESLEEYYPNQSYRFIFGCLKNKDYKNMSKNLFTEKDEIFFYKFSNPNALEINDLKAVCDYEIKDFSTFKQNKSNLTVICGSFYMIKELLAQMGIKYS